MDPERTVPGVCGCDVKAEDEAVCKGVKEALKHRYSFDGEGTEIKDSVGTAHGALVGNTLKGDGVLKLEGADQYVNLPNGIVSALGSATFEVWITWAGANVWERIFDFGDDTTGVEDARSTGGGYLFISPRGNGGDFMRAVYRKKGQAEVVLDVTPALAPDKQTHLALVFDDVNAMMTLYLDGNSLAAVPVPNKLSEIHDVNNWLGRSQWRSQYKDDKALVGTLHDFRIYGAALTFAQVEYSFNAGPDAKFLAK
jgi:large repetitive protein